VAEEIASALRTSHSCVEQERVETKQRLEKQRRALLSKLDRGYDDLVSRKITEDMWTRKSEQWEEERRSLEAELLRLERPNGEMMLTSEKILELAKQAEFLYKTQDPIEQRRLLETVLSNCTFDRGTLCPTYTKPFDLFVRGNKTGEWRGRRDSNSMNALF